MAVNVQVLKTVAVVFWYPSVFLLHLFPSLITLESCFTKWNPNSIYSTV